MAQVTLLQKFVAQHRAERRGERHRETMSHALLRQSPQHAKEWKVGFGQGLEEPVFLEEILVFRVPDERKMGVQNEGEMSWSRSQLGKTLEGEGRFSQAEVLESFRDSALQPC